MNIKDIIRLATQDYKIKLNDEQLNQLEQYYLMLVEWNQRMNLTAITEQNSVAVKHFADSLTFFNYIDVPEKSRIIDVGTGAGFPGVVLKIARPDIELTLLDSLNKRLNFLKEVTSKLNLSAKFIHGRAEDAANNVEYREIYDFAVARAVAQLNVLAEYCIPFVKTGGCFAAMKGPQADDEIKNAESALSALGGKIKNIFEFSLPMSGGERTIILIDKLKPTPQKYPRSSGKIKANPL